MTVAILGILVAVSPPPTGLSSAPCSHMCLSWVLQISVATLHPSAVKGGDMQWFELCHLPGNDQRQLVHVCVQLPHV
jgi:hypothetical protein